MIDDIPTAAQLRDDLRHRIATLERERDEARAAYCEAKVERDEARFMYLTIYGRVGLMLNLIGEGDRFPDKPEWRKGGDE